MLQCHQSAAECQRVCRKSLLRTLAEHTSSAGEREALLHLCSREGKQSYAANVLTPALGLLEVSAGSAPAR